NLPGLSAPYAAVPAGYTGTPSVQEFVPTAGVLNRCSVYRYASLIPASERGGVLLEGTYDPAPGLTVYGNVLGSHIQQYSHIAPPILYGTPGFQLYTVAAANPFNPFGETVGVSELVPSLGRVREDFRTNYLNAAVGIKGHLSPSWSWDLSLSDSEDRGYYVQS